jgi:hypothetical protein
MMSSLSRSAFAVFLALLASVSIARASDVEGTPIPRDPKPNFSDMAFLAGTWNCSIDSSRRPRPFNTKATTSIDSSGYWMVTRTITEPVPWNPITITTTDYVTYDPTTTRWIDISMDDYGAYDVSAAPGWTGNSIVWTEIAYPKLHGAAKNHPRTLTKIDNAKTVLDASFVESSGHRVRIRTTCTRA